MSLASDKHRVLFIHTHRTGGTSVRKALMAADPATRTIGFGHMTIDEVAALDDPARHYWTFAAVREPRSWLLSLFQYVRWSLAGHHDHQLVHGMAFDEFVHWLVEVGLKRDGTYRRQSEFVRGVASVYPYEAMGTAIPTLFHSVGFPDVNLGHELKSPRVTYYWSHDFSRYVEQHFAEDRWHHQRAMETWGK